jgi:D-alanyl-D-alanine carboxypeptidase
MVLRGFSQRTRVAAVLIALVGLLSPSAIEAQTQKATGTAAKKATPTRATPKKTYSASAARARRARLARARAAARAREAREAQTPRFRVDEFGQEVPDVRAEAAIIYNPTTREVLWSSNAESERSIASITKVMTALWCSRAAWTSPRPSPSPDRRRARLDHLPSCRIQGDG